MDEKTVKEVMRRRVTTVGEQVKVELALQLMLWREIRHLPVVREGRVTGILSDRDLLRAQGDPALGLEAKVRDVMRAPVEHTTPNALLADAAATLSTRKIDCLPVIDAGELVGILTTSDVLGSVAQRPIDPAARDTQESESYRAAALMTSDPATVAPDEPLLDAAAKLAARGVRHLVVVDAERQVVGMLSERDVRTQIGDPRAAVAEPEPSRRLAALRVRHAMTEGARVAVRDTPLADLVNIFLVERVGALPVVDADEKLVGIVSYIDVLRALAAGIVD